MDKKSLSKRKMEWFSKANIYIYCCIVSVLSLTSYLSAFSIEISWLLEARGDLPTASYLLCAGYFVLFIASTILIHGLATHLPWGLLSWSTIIAVISIPEFYLVIYMITQHWGFESIHGLTELIGYLLRLVINVLALSCVIPTALHWRSEKRIQKQLESLANRLQLTTPLPDAQISSPMQGHVIIEKNQSGSVRSTSSRRSRTGFSNLGFEAQGERLPPVSTQDATLTSSSENEFNASIFGLNPSMYIGPPDGQHQAISKKTQSLLDLRYLLSPKSLMARTKDDQEMFKLNNDQNHNTISPTSTISSRKLGNKSKVSNVINKKATKAEEPLYHTILDAHHSKETAKSLTRNCVSLENLTAPANTAFFRDDLNMYGNNLLQNYGMQWHPGHFRPFAYPPPQYYFYFSPYSQHHVHQHPSGGPYFNPYVSSNSRQSIGTSSTDDFRKYRDVAL